MDHGLALTLTGFLVGLIVGMTGVGGGSLMTPALIGLFRVPPAIAVGTDLAFAALTKSIGTSADARHQGVDWRIVRQMLAGSLPAAALCMLWLHFGGSGSPLTGVSVTTTRSPCWKV